MKKTRSKMFALIMVMTMLLSIVTSSIHINAERTQTPDIAVNLEPSEVNLVPGQEFTVEVELMLLTTDIWAGASFYLHYDPEVIEIIPYRSIPGFDAWAGSDMNEMWRRAGGSFSINPRVFGNNGHIVINFLTFTNNNPFAPFITLRFRVLDYAAVGETLIRWTPISVGFYYSGPSWRTANLYFAEPSLEHYARLMISPQLGVNVESRVESVNSGDEFLVDIELSVLTGIGWAGVTLDIFYDRTRLELIPYFTLPYDWFPDIYVGSNPNDIWRLLGGNVAINPYAYQGYGDIWEAAMLFTNFGSYPNIFPATVTLRFRVRDDASAGDALISWAPSQFGATTLCGDMMLFEIPMAESFALIAVNH